MKLAALLATPLPPLLSMIGLKIVMHIKIMNGMMEVQKS
jgi:hypothetical protein